jgi:Na+:H+ antiporter
MVGTVEVTLLVLVASILLGPILGAKLRVPGLLALIFLGMVFGPFGLGWMGRLDLVTDLGAIGILYLMFLAGLGFNLNAFMESRTSAIAIGILSFVFPFVLSVATVLTFYEAGILAAALVGAMWASNTLVAYPDVKAAGLEDSRPVRHAVSAGVVADVLSLLVLALVTSHTVVETVDPSAPGASAGRAPSLPLVITIPVLVIFALWVLPKLGRWFFTRVGRSRLQRALFALVAMAATGSLAVAAGLEGIIGAFLAGIGLNRLIPKNSELMERIDFVGSTLFIPAFLVSIGLRIDPAAMFDLETVAMGFAFAGLVVVGKSLASLVAAWFVKYTFAEAGLMATLSFGQAASTLAIAQVGLELGLFRQQVVNASIIAIVLTALATSFGTQTFARRVPAPEHSAAAFGEIILVDVRPDESETGLLIEFAGRIARGDDGLQIPFTISTVAEKGPGRERLVGAATLAETLGYDVEGVARLSESFVDGTLEVIGEVDATMVVLGWDGPRVGSDYLFGSDVDSIGRQSSVPVIAAHLIRPWDRVIVVPGNAEVRWQSQDAQIALRVATRIRASADAPVVVIGPHRELVQEEVDARDKLEFISSAIPGEDLLEIIRDDDIVIAPAYLLPDLPLARRLRLANRLAESNVVVVGGPGKLSVAPAYLTHAMESILGPKL